MHPASLGGLPICALDRSMVSMFTGIVQHVGRVTDVSATSAGKRLRIDLGPLAEALAPGASLAVDGVCLTASAVAGAEAEFDAVPETLGRTTLGPLVCGSRVNLERPLAAGDPLDGHIVLGHVDGTARVVRVDRSTSGHVVHLAAAAELTGQMVPKGSVALAGVSLTIADLGEGRLSVALVPATLQRTTFGELRSADLVNVELDVIGKYVRRWLAELSGPGGLTIKKLREAGFA